MVEMIYFIILIVSSDFFIIIFLPILSKVIEINCLIFYCLLPEMCTAFNLEANWFQLYKGEHEVTDIIK